MRSLVIYVPAGLPRSTGLSLCRTLQQGTGRRKPDHKPCTFKWNTVLESDYRQEAEVVFCQLLVQPARSQPPRLQHRPGAWLCQQPDAMYTDCGSACSPTTRTVLQWSVCYTFSCQLQRCQAQASLSEMQWCTPVMHTHIFLTEVLWYAQVDSMFKAKHRPSAGLTGVSILPKVEHINQAHPRSCSNGK